MNKLKITKLSKTYPGGIKALDNVSLTIENGLYGLLGANGAGKSTLMQIIACLQEPGEGTITFNDINIMTHPYKIREQLGYLPQEFGVYPGISAEKLLNHIGILKGIVNSNERREQAGSLLQKTNLYEYRKRSVHTFSGGMRQRFGIAQALLAHPQLIIVDEPTAGLDPEERNRFLNVLSELGENVIVILSTHLVADVFELCSNMAILSYGQIIEKGNPTELATMLKNKVWYKTIPKTQLSDYQTNYEVISSRLVAGKIGIRVLADGRPGKGFESIAPELEDVYFTAKMNSKITQTTKI